MKTLHEILLFGVAGVFGLIVDTSVLYLLAGAIGPFYARAVSFFAAVFATWMINRMFAFRERKSALSKRREFVVYFVLMLAGGAANYGLYSWLVITYPLVQEHLVVGVGAGSIAGMFINFIVSRYLLFRFAS